jgi:hypothetical protein
MAKYLRTQSLVTVQCMVVGAIPDKEWEATFQGLVKKLSETPSSPSRWATNSTVSVSTGTLLLVAELNPMTLPSSAGPVYVCICGCEHSHCVDNTAATVYRQQLWVLGRLTPRCQTSTHLD